MSFPYFAYGSNLWPPQVRARCPSARAAAAAALEGWAVVYDKPSLDGSSKLNIAESAGSEVMGVVYEVADDERPLLDSAEHRYDPIYVSVATEGGRVEALTYQWAGPPHDALPFDWYVATARAGAAHHGLPERCLSSLSSDVEVDPIAPGVRPVPEAGLPALVEMLSGPSAGGGRLRLGDSYRRARRAAGRTAQTSYWRQGDAGVLMIDAAVGEIAVFARPGAPASQMIEWAQRRLGGRGEVVCFQPLPGSPSQRRATKGVVAL